MWLDHVFCQSERYLSTTRIDPALLTIMTIDPLRPMNLYVGADISKGYADFCVVDEDENSS